MTENKQDWSRCEKWIEENRTPRPEVKYNPNYKRTKGAEKRIKSLLRRQKSFILHTVSIVDNKTPQEWLVGTGGWVAVLDEEVNKYDRTLGHIKNLLEFLGGPQPLWYDPTRPEKRKYIRRTVKRGGL